MYDITWLLRGAQSAVFYYVSCSPYTRRRNRRRRAREIEEDRLAQQAIEEQNPHLYRQPSPYRRNKFWEEDIRMGPDRSDRRKGRNRRQQPGKREEMTTMSQPALELAQEKEQEQPTLDPLDEKVGLEDALFAGPHQAQAQAKTDTMPVDHRGSAAHMAEVAMDDIKNFMRNAAESGKQKWNAMRQQRPDEELWGLPSANHSSIHQASYSSKASSLRPSARGDSSLRFPRLGRTDTLDSYSTDSFQTVARIPPVNDLHPPIVSHPILSKNANRWMKQPPPPPSVMGGFEHSSRNGSVRGSRSGSVNEPNASSSNLGLTVKRSGDGSLQRKVSDRAVRDKLRSNDAEPTLLLAVPEPAHLRPRTPTSAGLHKTRSEQSTSDRDEPRTPDSAVDMNTAIAERDFALAAAPPTSNPIRSSIHRAVSSSDRPTSPVSKHSPKSAKKITRTPQPLHLRTPSKDKDSFDTAAPLSPDSAAAWRFHYPYPLDTWSAGLAPKVHHKLDDRGNDHVDDEEHDADDSDVALDGIERTRRGRRVSAEF